MSNEIRDTLEGLIPHEKRGHVVVVPRFAWNGLLLLVAILSLGALGHVGWVAMQNWALQERVTTLETDKQNSLYDLTRRVTTAEVEITKLAALANRQAVENRELHRTVEFLKGKLDGRQQ